MKLYKVPSFMPTYASIYKAFSSLMSRSKASVCMRERASYHSLSPYSAESKRGLSHVIWSKSRAANSSIDILVSVQKHA